MNDSRPAKLKCRFSLRTLLVAVLIVGTAFGWLGAKLQRARKNRLAAAENRRVQGEIEMSGGEVEIQWLQSPNSLEVLLGDPGVSVVVAVRGATALSPAASGFDDAVLKHVNELKELQRLCLACTAITDKGLRHLRQLTSLQSLSLLGTQVTDAGLEYLKGLSELEQLDVSYICVTGAGANGLKEVLPRVTITPTPVQLRAKDEIVKLGGRLKWQPRFQTNDSISAKSVRLFGTKVTDTSLQHLNALPNLRSLDVTGTQVSDLGLKHLIGLTNLRKLDLQHTPVTDAGLEHLRGLKRLRSLNVGATQVTREGVRRLREALPNCKID